MDIYEKSVGGNATFLLNIPPDRRGLFDDPDVLRLREFGAYLRRCYSVNLAPEAVVEADASVPGHGIRAVLQENDDYYLPVSASQPVRITLRWPEPRLLHRVVLKEAIFLGQRVERFHLEIPEDSGWKTVAENTVIGHKRIVRLDGLLTDCLRLVIDDARVCPILSFLAVYQDTEPDKAVRG